MITGKYLTAVIGSTAIDGTHEWDVSETADRLEATTAAHYGRGKKDVGVIDTRIKIRFYFDITTGEAAFIRTGTVLSNLALYADGTADEPIYLFDSATVFDFRLGGQIRDRFVVDVDIEANGGPVNFSDGN